MIACLFDAYPKPSSTKIIDGLFEVYYILQIVVSFHGMAKTLANLNTALIVGCRVVLAVLMLFLWDTFLLESLAKKLHGS